MNHFAPGMVKQIAELAEARPKDGDFKRLVKGIGLKFEKEVMMRGVLFVQPPLTASLDGKEQKFVGCWPNGHEPMHKEKIHQLLAEVASARQQRAASMNY